MPDDGHLISLLFFFLHKFNGPSAIRQFCKASVEVKAFLFGGHQKSFAQCFLIGVVGQFEIMDARVDRWIAPSVRIDFSNDS